MLELHSALGAFVSNLKAQNHVISVQHADRCGMSIVASTELYPPYWLGVSSSDKFDSVPNVTVINMFIRKKRCQRCSARSSSVMATKS